MIEVFFFNQTLTFLLIACVTKLFLMHPHKHARTHTHKHHIDTHCEYKQGLLVFLSLASTKAVSGHLEHDPLGEQQVGPHGLNELLALSS